MSLVAPYQHRQLVAIWILALLVGVIAFEVFVAIIIPPPARRLALPIIAIEIVVLLTLMWMLSVMQTRVDRNGVSWSLAWGWPGGHLPFANIAAVEPTELNWLERGNSGLTWTMWHGWLWHAAGSHAVEITKTDGGRLTLGTDDPQGLADAIERFRRGAA